MYTPWSRTFSITKEVFRAHVLLKIPFQTIPVQDLRVESWQAYKEGNIMHILLQRDSDDCLVTKMLKDKREDYRFAVYPGERLR